MGGPDYDLSSFQYAFSTIAQTIATGFALLSAVVMYRLQLLTATFPRRVERIEANLKYVKQADSKTNIEQARERGDWESWLVFANDLGINILNDKKNMNVSDHYYRS